MYVLYNIQGNVLLTKLMRKLYQILYTVGRLTYAPARRAFFFLGDTLAVGVSLSGGHLSSGQVCEGERRSELRSPLFPLALPLSGHVAVLRCGMLQCIGKILYSSVLVVWGLCRWVCGERKTKLLLFAISQGTGPLRGPLSRPAEQKNRLSLTPPIQQHTD